MKNLLYKKTVLLCAFFALASCTSKKAALIKLTGLSGSKYWDKIYSTDIYGRYQNPLTKRGQINTCTKFEFSGRVTHYDCPDSVKVTIAGCNSDVVYNPDSFILESDSIILFGGRKYLIYSISENFMILRFGPKADMLATVIYASSKFQKKELVSCK